jgi:hypothetical protein
MNSKEEAMRWGRVPAEFSAAMREASNGRLRNGPLQLPEPSRPRDRESFFHCTPDPVRPKSTPRNRRKFGRLGQQARKWQGRIPPADRLEGEAAGRRLMGLKFHGDPHHRNIECEETGGEGRKDLVQDARNK